MYFASFIEELFETTTKDEAFALIDNASVFLRCLEGARLQGGPVAYANKELLEFEDGKKSKEIDFANRDDDDLRGLAEGLKANNA